MGAQDYETLATTMCNGVPKLQKICENKNFLRFLGKDIEDYNAIAPLNKHCFKFTKLREDCYFILCKLSANIEVEELDGDEKPIITTKHVEETRFVLVNEMSFYKRFKIYKNSTSMDIYRYSFENNIVDIINSAINHDGKLVDHIQLALLETETEYLTKNKINTAFVNNADCEFLSVYTFNKRVIAEFFDNFVLYKPSAKKASKDSIESDSEVKRVNSKGEEIVFSINLGSYKEKTSVLYYDPNDSEYSKYKLLYVK